jgi:hypothetical protein
MRVLYHLSIHDPLIIMSRPQESRNEQTKYRLNLLLNSPCYNLTVTVNSSDRWTPFFSVPRWYDAVASHCHLFSRDHDHVAETSRADHYRAPCGNCRIAPLAPTSDGWDDRCVPLSYKKGKPLRGVAIAKSRLLSNWSYHRSCFPLRLVFGHPATNPSPLLLRSLTEQAV